MTSPIFNTQTEVRAATPIDISEFLSISNQEIARSYVKTSLQPVAPQTLRFLNSSTQYELKIDIPEGNGVDFDPQSFSLAPNTYIDVVVRFDSAQLEAFQLGTNILNFPVLISSPTLPTEPSGQWVRYMVQDTIITSQTTIVRTETRPEPANSENNFEAGFYRIQYAVDTVTTTTPIYDYRLEGGPTSLPKPPQEGGETTTTTSAEYVFSREYLQGPTSNTGTTDTGTPTTSTPTETGGTIPPITSGPTGGSSSGPTSGGTASSPTQNTPDTTGPIGSPQQE